MNKRFQISVCKKGENCGEPGEEFGKKISRVLKTECIGNFNPIFCTYKNRERLVKSLLGDLSDPFRREKNYLEHLYIEI